MYSIENNEILLAPLPKIWHSEMLFCSARLQRVSHHNHAVSFKQFGHCPLLSFSNKAFSIAYLKLAYL